MVCKCYDTCNITLKTFFGVRVCHTSGNLAPPVCTVCMYMCIHYSIHTSRHHFDPTKPCSRKRETERRTLHMLLFPIFRKSILTHSPSPSHLFLYPALPSFHFYLSFPYPLSTILGFPSTIHPSKTLPFSPIPLIWGGCLSSFSISQLKFDPQLPPSHSPYTHALDIVFHHLCIPYIPPCFSMFLSLLLYFFFHFPHLIYLQIGRTCM